MMRRRSVLVRPTGWRRRRPEGEDTVANYVLVFKGGGMAETEAEQQAVMAAWGEWYGKLG
jgi:hypothetical protein